MKKLWPSLVGYLIVVSGMVYFRRPAVPYALDNRHPGHLCSQCEWGQLGSIHRNDAIVGRGRSSRASLFG